MMTIIEALKTGRPLRRRTKSFSYNSGIGPFLTTTYMNPKNFIDPIFLLDAVKLTKADLIANDWVVMKGKKK